jgi:hypothetical protein
MGGTFALCVALFLNAGFYVAAYVIEAFFLAAPAEFSPAIERPSPIPTQA